MYTKSFIARILRQRDAIKANTAKIVQAVRNGFRPNGRGRN